MKIIMMNFRLLRRQEGRHPRPGRKQPTAHVQVDSCRLNNHRQRPVTAIIAFSLPPTPFPAMAERRDSCAAPPAGFNRTTLKRVVFLFGLLLAGPQAARGESLLDLYHAALAHDARWRSAVAGHQAGIGKLPQRYSALF